MTTADIQLLQLVRIALGKEDGSSLPNNLLWQEVFDCSKAQDVCALCSSAAMVEGNPCRDEWQRYTEAVAAEYFAHAKLVVDLVRFYQRHGISTMLLKGAGLSINYPVPEHRPTGDIDVFLFRDGVAAWRQGDEAVRSVGCEVDDRHEHHTLFCFKGVLVENHYDIVDRSIGQSSSVIDDELKRLALAAPQLQLLHHSVLYLPPATFNAIFLLRHLGQHFAGERVVLRHLLDYALYMQSHSHEVDWLYTIALLQRVGLEQFACCINSICVQHLGIEASHFHGQLSTNDALTQRILDDILHPEFHVQPPKRGLALKALFLTQRYFANAWKRKIIYKEGLLTMYLLGSVAHLKEWWRNR